ncbi:MAG: Gfo/Idh/MocA family oxidoreductase [Candidatus Omnitrophota bacterium]
MKKNLCRGKVKVAVIGAGHLGKIHCRIYSQSKDAQLIGICDIDAQRAKIHAQTFRTQSFTNYQDLLDKVDAVSIATPTTNHFKTACAFLKNNIHVMIEKPITTTTQQAQKLINLAQKKKCILQVGHVERFNPAIKTIQKFCKYPKFIEVHRLSPYPKRGTDVGVVLDLMIHDIDIIQVLVKSRIKSFQAIGVKVLSKFEDIANARIIFANGTVCNLTASRISADTLRKIRIFQNNSYLSIDYAQQKIDFYEKKGLKIIHREITVLKKEPLVEELNSFLHCIKQGKKPVVCGINAKKALKIALAITKQIHKNN